MAPPRHCHLIVSAQLLLDSLAIAQRQEPCALWLAESTLMGAGQGVFVGKDAEPGTILSVARQMRVPRPISETTQLADYVFSTYSQGNESLLMLGSVPMVNHGPHSRVNAKVHSISQNFAELRAFRRLAAGEELLVSYGNAEWFSDRGIMLASGLESAAAQSEPDHNTPLLAKQLEKAERDGVCLVDIRPDPSGCGILASRQLVAGYSIVSPAFVLARKSVGNGALMDNCIGHDNSEVLILPATLPGRLLDGGENPTATYKIITSGATPFEAAQALCDTETPPVELHLTLLRELQEGEAITVTFGNAAGMAVPACRGPTPAQDGIFPSSWADDVWAARLRAAEAGQLRSQYMYAQGFALGALGDDVAPNASAAVTWFRKAAEQGHVSAQLRMGLAYRDGMGVESDVAVAAEWYKKAAVQGSASAQFLLGVAYTNGEGVLPNDTKAFAWLRKAAEQGSSNLLKSEKAMYNIGMGFLEGRGMPASKTEALTWFIKAAQRGHARAQYNLGVAYSRGDGVATNATAASTWFGQAARQGHVLAQFSLAHAYSTGSGVPADAVAAADWMSQAAEQGHVHAQFTMGMWHSGGLGVPLDLEAAAQWYSKAALQGDARAQHNLGLISSHKNKPGFWKQMCHAAAQFLQRSLLWPVAPPTRTDL